MSKRDQLVPDSSLYDLAFDQFSRQYQVKRLVESVRQKKKLSILDVGGNNGKTRDFFPKDEVMIVDLYDLEEPGYTKASALDLPFDDNSYDVVTCFDVFEHIEAADRAQFLAEITRVAKHYIIVAAPFNTTYVSQAEQELNAYYRHITDHDHRWLREHIDNGLPEQSEIEQFFHDRHVQYQTYNSNNILLWTALQNLIFLADAVKAPERISLLNRYYNEHLATIGDDAEPSYRRIYFGIKDGQVPSQSDVREAINLEDIRLLINKAALAMHELVYGSEPILAKSEAIKTQAEMLAEKDRQIAKLSNELNDILGSRSYRLAQTLKKTKNAIFPKRPQ